MILFVDRRLPVAPWIGAKRQQGIRGAPPPRLQNERGEKGVAEGARRGGLLLAVSGIGDPSCQKKVLNSGRVTTARRPGASPWMTALPKSPQREEVAPNALPLLTPDRVEEMPWEDRGVVEVVERQAEAVKADELSMQDGHVSPARRHRGLERGAAAGTGGRASG